jgi:hypothetical protein
MLNTYEMEITCACPADDLPDVYKMTVIARRVIPVETIIAAAHEYKYKKIYQEDLCQELHRKINACVVLVGYHSGVKLTSKCGECC